MGENKQVDPAEVARVYAKLKSTRKTAATLGLSPSTVLYHLKNNREPVSTTEPSHVKRIRDLERLVEKQDARLAGVKAASRFKLPKIGKTKSIEGSFCRVILPDTHGCKADKSALVAALGDIVKINPNEIVLLGDHLDASSFLAQHHTFGYVAETDYSFEEDVAATNLFLDELQKSAPSARIHYLEGNHERRIQKFCVTQALQNPKDAKYLYSLFSVKRLLGLEERGIQFYEQGVFYDNLPIPATIKLGHCYFTHGSSTAKNPARAHVDMFAGNVVFGHVHRSDMASSRTVGSGVVCAWCPGCLCVLQPLWQHTNITGWSHGIAVQLVQEDGSFLHIQIPILDGRSYFLDITSRLNG